MFAAAHVRAHVWCAAHRCAGCRESECAAQWLLENGKQLAPLEVALRARQVQTLSRMLGVAQVRSRILVFIPEPRQRSTIVQTQHGNT
jgi:hypothetical protein